MCVWEREREICIESLPTFDTRATAFEVMDANSYLHLWQHFLPLLQNCISSAAYAQKKYFQKIRDFLCQCAAITYHDSPLILCEMIEQSRIIYVKMHFAVQSKSQHRFRSFSFYLVDLGKQLRTKWSSFMTYPYTQLQSSTY